MKRILAMFFAAMLLLSCCTALADNTWNCYVCGAKDNAWNFCPSCGSERPPERNQNEWDCNNCGKTGNVSNFCPSCGKTKSEAVAPTPVTTRVKVGDIVKFGRYEQDNNFVNGKEDLQWVVLDVQGSKALLLTRQGLSRQSFNPTSNRQTWHNSAIRTWLNKTFLNDAFLYSEQNEILTTAVDESLSQCHPNYAPKRLGENTNDKVFLLSYAEALKYMPTERDRMCVPTIQCVREGGNESDKRYLDGEYKTCWYWLRSPAYNNNLVCVDWNGKLETCYMSHAYGVVRPAIWVNVSAID